MYEIQKSDSAKLKKCMFTKAQLVSFSLIHKCNSLSVFALCFLTQFLSHLPPIVSYVVKLTYRQNILPK